MATQAAPHRYPDATVRFSGHGAPTNGVTGKRFALRGSEYLDLDTGYSYRNYGTVETPAWVQADLAVEQRQNRHVHYTAPIGADDDILVLDTEISDGDILGAVQPDFPRAITVTTTDADSTAVSTLTLEGLDANGDEAEEAFDLSGGSQVQDGEVAFSVITSAVLSGTSGSLRDEDQTLTPSGGPAVNEVQHVALTGFSGPVAEVQTATITNGDGPTNEVQRIKFGVANGSATDPTSGSFTLTFTTTTGAIAFDASADDVLGALIALSGISSGDVSVVKVGQGDYEVTFGGTLAATNVAQITGTGTLLVGVDSPYSVTGSTTQAGKDADTIVWTWSGQSTSALAWNADEATVQSAIDGLSNVPNPGDILVTDLGGGVLQFSFVGATLAGINVDEMTSTPTGCTVVHDTTVPGYGGDKFKLTHGGQETADSLVHPQGWYGGSDEPYSEANVKAFIEGISGFTGTVTITNLTTAGFDCEFGGALAGTNVTALSVTSGVGVTGVVTTPTAGKPAGTFTITHDGKTTGAIAQNAAAAGLQSALDGATLTDVIASGAASGPWGLSFVGAYGNSDQALVTTTPTNMTVTPLEVNKGQGDTVSIGVGTVLGLPTAVRASGLEVYKALEDSGDAAVGTVDQDNDTIDPDGAPDGSTDYDFFYHFDIPVVN